MKIRSLFLFSIDRLPSDRDITSSTTQSCNVIQLSFVWVRPMEWFQAWAGHAVAIKRIALHDDDGGRSGERNLSNRTTWRWHGNPTPPRDCGRPAPVHHGGNDRPVQRGVPPWATCRCGARTPPYWARRGSGLWGRGSWRCGGRRPRNRQGGGCSWGCFWGTTQQYILVILIDHIDARKRVYNSSF